MGFVPLQPTPAPLPTEGLWECCNSCTRAAAHVLLLLYPGYCCSSGPAAALQPTPAPLPSEGLWGVLQQLHSGEGGGVQGRAPPPPAEMQHIHKELQKCTTLTHTACTCPKIGIF